MARLIKPRPTPWSVEENKYGLEVVGPGDSPGQVWQIYHKNDPTFQDFANASHIVRCVNERNCLLALAENGKEDFKLRIRAEKLTRAISDLYLLTGQGSVLDTCVRRVNEILLRDKGTRRRK